VDPVLDPLLARNRTRTSGSVARNSGHWTTETIYFVLHNIHKFSSYLIGITIHLHCVARISDRSTTQAVYITYIKSFRTSGIIIRLRSEPGTLTTRPQRRSAFLHITNINSVLTCRPQSRYET
jgi:hypothetical protein